MFRPTKKGILKLSNTASLGKFKLTLKICFGEKERLLAGMAHVSWADL
jgi:hypothetical protein